MNRFLTVCHLLCALFLASSGLRAEEQRLTLAQGAHLFWLQGNDRRAVELTAHLPAALQDHARIKLRLALRCPSGRCDAWDRVGTFGIVQNDSQEGRRYLELTRFITPYGIGGEWVTDLSDFAPLLRGDTRFRIFIETWVGPGHAQGNGWLVDAHLEYTPQATSPRPTKVVPLMSYVDLPYGHPAQTPRRAATVSALGGHKAAKLKMIITGHGQGNAENCAEFCPKTHSVRVGATTYSQLVWRDDCAYTVSQAQRGNWRSPRAGWCTGDVVRVWDQDVTGAFGGGSPTVTYEVEPYENSCRPDAPRCGGCVFRTSCAYDDGMHTPPRYYVTGYLVYFD